MAGTLLATAKAFVGEGVQPNVLVVLYTKQGLIGTKPIEGDGTAYSFDHVSIGSGALTQKASA